MARYRRSHAETGISLECETERVPADGRYHICRGGEIASSHRTLKAGTAAYLKLLAEAGVSTKPPAPKTPADTGNADPSASSRLFGDFYIYGKSKRRKTGTRTYG